MTYAEKLKDPRWIQFRDAFLLRKRRHPDEPAECIQCGDTEGLHVHHRRYIAGREPWKYDDADLLVLCGECHGYIHDQEKRTRTFLIGLKPHEMMEWKRLLGAIEEFWRENDIQRGMILSCAANEIEELVWAGRRNRELFAGKSRVMTLLEALKEERDLKLWIIDTIERKIAKKCPSDF